MDGSYSTCTNTAIPEPDEVLADIQRTMIAARHLVGKPKVILTTKYGFWLLKYLSGTCDKEPFGAIPVRACGTLMELLEAMNKAIGDGFEGVAFIPEENMTFEFGGDGAKIPESFHEWKRQLEREITAAMRIPLPVMFGKSAKRFAQQKKSAKR